MCFWNHKKRYRTRVDAFLEVNSLFISDSILMLHEVNRNLFHAMYRSCKGFTAPFSLILHSDHEVIAVNFRWIATINRKATVLTVEDKENELMDGAMEK